jgi:cysteinyl-tRNA synthetase
MAQTIFNTLTRNKDPFEPAEPGHVRMYVCGPTVYDQSHIGHARVYVAFDVISRYLRRSNRVTYVRNFTDVDDKIIKKATAEGVEPRAISERYIEAFHADMSALSCQPVDVEPKVTENIEQIVAFIEGLVARESAYAAGGDVMYAVQKHETYGRLSRRTLDDMEAGARVEVNAAKRHPMDFVLWKAAKPGEPSWPSPWGEGRPGWHIECSAMSLRYLGASFDLHGGGRDLIFPHHENEMAQSEAGNDKPYAHCWLHNGLVNIDNEKMSKSLGNFFTIGQVLEKFDPQTLRYYLLATHYRSPINFSDAGLGEAEVRVRYIYDTLARVHAYLEGAPQAQPGESQTLRDPYIADIVARMDTAMQDDFNTPQAIGDLSDVFKIANEVLDRPRNAQHDANTLRTLVRSLEEVSAVLGLFGEPPQQVLERLDARHLRRAGLDAARIQGMVDEREQARVGRDFARADKLRDELVALGVVLKDGPKGTQWHVGG